MKNITFCQPTPPHPQPQPVDVTHVASSPHSEKTKKINQPNSGLKCAKENTRFNNNGKTSISHHKTQVKWAHQRLRTSRCDDQSALLPMANPPGCGCVCVYIYRQTYGDFTNNKMRWDGPSWKPFTLMMFPLKHPFIDVLVDYVPICLVVKTFRWKKNHVGSIAPPHVPGWGVFETPHVFLFEAAD